MGVGAVFISSLALTRLPVPHDPPQNQQELLAAVLQPITAFIVLGSIVVRKFKRGHNSSLDQTHNCMQMDYPFPSFPSDARSTPARFHYQRLSQLALAENLLTGFCGLDVPQHFQENLILPLQCRMRTLKDWLRRRQRMTRLIRQPPRCHWDKMKLVRR